MNQSDDDIRAILKTVSDIAVVGMSTNPVRPSYFVGRYLTLRGYRVHPVNPAYEGRVLFGNAVRSSLEALADAVERIDMIDIFRRSEEAPAIVEAAIRHFGNKGLSTIWMQIGVENAEAAEMARAAGLRVVMNRCPKIEYQRLVGELSMGGFNTGHLSSKMT